MSADTNNNIDCTMKSTIPTIDISPLVRLDDEIRSGLERHNNVVMQQNDEELKVVINQIKHACETYGFFAVTNHGVNSDVIANAWNVSKDFFDSDASIKASVPMTPSYPYGYENFESLGIERTASTASTDAAAVDEGGNSLLLSDSKETFSIGPANSDMSGMPSRQFPQGAPSTFATALELYFTNMEHLAQILFRALALALELDDISWFLQDGRFDEGHQSALRVLNYPRLEYKKENDRCSIRAGAHTDYGAMTILKSGGPGLQLQLSSQHETAIDNTDESSSWIDVPHLEEENALVINLGDLMQRWTNEKWKSTLHRVVAVADKDDHANESSVMFQSARRQSIAFFVNVNGNATISPFESCIDKDHPSKYDAIKASDHLIQRHRQSMSMKKSI